MTITKPNHGDPDWDVTLNAALDTLDAADTTEATARASGDTANATALTTHKTSSDHDGRYVRTVNGAGPDGSGNVAGGALPTGVTSTDGKTPVAGSLILDPESLTGWSSNNVVSALALDSTFFTLGAQSVKCGLKVSANTSYMRHNFASPPSVGGHQLFAFDFYYTASGGQSVLTSDVLRANVADAVDLGGTKIAVNFPNIAASQWATIYIDVSALSTLRSFGITTDGGTVDDTTGAGMTCRVDNVRFADKTELDAALASATNVAVLIAPGFAPTGSQAFRALLATQTVVDFRPASVNITGLRGERSVRDWLGIDETGLTDVSAQMQSIAGALNNGDKLTFPPKGQFWLDTMVVFRNKTDIEIDLNGCTLFSRKYRGALLAGGKENNLTDSFFRFENCKKVTLRNGRIIGSRPKVNTGAELQNLAGAPATVSTTKTLAAQGDQVASPNDNDGNTPFYARHIPVMFPTATRALLAAAYPSFTFGNAFELTLSDSAQVAGDCVLELLADDDRTVVLASRTLTLSATPTTYVIAYEPPDTHRNYVIGVRKATATTNTITVTDMTRHGFTFFDDKHDSASVITSANTQDFLVENMLIEGAATDAVDGADANNARHTVRGVVSRCANRQAFSFNRGQDFVMEDSEGSEPARSGVDIEPYDRHWLVRGMTVRDCKFWNVTNSAIACPNWANIEDLNVIGCEAHGTGEQLFNGGARGGNVDVSGSTAWKYGKYRTPGGTAATVNGQGMRVRIATDSSVQVGSSYKLYQRPNAAATTLTAPVFAADLTISVASSAGFPATGGFLIDIKNEVMLVTNVSGTTWTVTRAQEGSSIPSDLVKPLTGEAVTLLERYYPDDNTVDLFLTGGTGYKSPVGRRNNVTQWVAGRPTPITTTTAVTGADNYAVRGRGVASKTFPYSFGDEQAPTSLWVPGGHDFRSQALSAVRGLSSAGRTTATLLSSSARTTGGTSTVVDLGTKGLSGLLRFAVTAASGTGTLDVTVEVSQDNTNWYQATTLTQIVGVSQEFVPILYAERYVRLTYLIYGTSPSFTCEADLSYLTPSSNLAGVGTVLAGQTSAAVGFTAPTAPGSIFSAAYASSTGGSLANSTTYYYRLGTRTRLYGPKTWRTEASVTTAAGGNAANLTITRWHNDAKLGLATLGFTLLRGTSPGVYTQRYDVTPMTGIVNFQIRHDTSVWKDVGGSLTPATNATGFPTTYPTPSPLLTVTDESALELDTAYRVWVTPSWDCGRFWVSAKTTGGFTFNCTTAPGADSTFDWGLLR